jgi:hypothetical protein
VETNTQVGTCQEVEAVNIWQREIAGLLEWMTTQDTCDVIKTSLYSALQRWQAGKAHHIATSEVGVSQERIGWGLLIEGCLSLDWRLLQQGHYDLIGSKRRRWASSSLVIRLSCGNRNHMEHKQQEEVIESDTCAEVKLAWEKIFQATRTLNR